jgi:hypothetical protein
MFRSIFILLLLIALSGTTPAAEPEPASERAGIQRYVGRAPEMDRLLGLAGNWRFTMEVLDRESGEWQPGPVFFGTFTAVYDGRYIESEHVMPLSEVQAMRNRLILSYDKFRRRYRLILLEDVVGLIDVFEGEFHGDELLMDDERTNTAAPNLAGKLEFVRLGLRFVDPDQVIIRTQAKRAERWVDGMRLRLQRQRLP